MVRGALLLFTLLWLVFLLGNSTAEVTQKKGKIRGRSYVNLRSGPGRSHPPSAVLREGDKVTVNREEAGWYLVSSTAGKRGYVYKTFVQFSVKAETEEGLEKEAVTKTGETGKTDLRISPPQGVEGPTPEAKPLWVIQVLEGKKWNMLWWVGLVLCIFIIGWICGGNYYLRRDRIRRTKLRF